MKLIRFEDYELKVADEALLVKPIRKLYNKDRSKDKENFFSAMSVVYFMSDPSSPYMYIPDEKKRLNEIKKQEGLPKEWKLTSEIAEIIEINKKLVITASTEALRSSRLMVSKLSEYLEGIDFYAMDKNGKPLYPLNTITSTIKQIPDLVKALTEAERAVEQEQKAESRARGGAAKSIFEDGIEIN